MQVLVLMSSPVTLLHFPPMNYRIFSMIHNLAGGRRYWTAQCLVYRLDPSDTAEWMNVVSNPQRTQCNLDALISVLIFPIVTEGQRVRIAAPRIET
jgi:hypothetical protein